MVRVKVCGIRTLKEGLWAIEAGADALGFVFHPGSRRYVEPGRVRAITAELPPFVASVGVFVDQPREVVENLVVNCGLTAAQLHGSEQPRDWRGCWFPLIKALKMPPAGQATMQVRANENNLSSFPEEFSAWQGIARAILLDSTRGGQFGGTGTVLPWADELLQSWVTSIKEAGFQVILAGGLTAENVREGIRLIRPYAVDVSSGVERDGQKDQALLRKFLQQALTAV